MQAPNSSKPFMRIYAARIGLTVVGNNRIPSFSRSDAIRGPRLGRTLVPTGAAMRLPAAFDLVSASGTSRGPNVRVQGIPASRSTPTLPKPAVPGRGTRQYAPSGSSSSRRDPRE